MFTSFVVFLDACVLVPNWLRDVLLTAADFDLYRPRWSPTVLEETHRTLVSKRNRTTEQADYIIEAMTSAFPEALMTGYEKIVPAMPNDKKDRHVLAAALVGRAQLIVTNNLKHFPEADLAPLHLHAKTADTFLNDLLARYPNEMLDVLKFMADKTGKTGRPELSLYDVVQAIGGTARNFAAAALFHYQIT